MSRRNFIKKAAKISAIGAGLALGLSCDRPTKRPEESPAATDKEPAAENIEAQHSKLLHLLFKDIPEPETPDMKELIALEKSKLARDFNSRLDSALPYLPHVMKIFQEEGVPPQLSLLALPESGFEISATSHRQAHGPFQLTRRTAEAFGLRISRSIDERRDPFLASRAAARFLRDLYDRVEESWPMAILAYNSGMALKFDGDWPEYIRHVTQDQYSKHKLTRRSSRESLHYLPRFFATRQLFQERVCTAASLGVPKRATQFEIHLAETRPPKFHLVRKGEKLSRLARHLGITTENLCDWNKISDPRRIRPGQKLVYYTGTANTPRPKELALAAGMSLEKLGADNPSWSDEVLEKNYQLPSDFFLTLPAPATLPPESKLNALITSAPHEEYRFAADDFWENLAQILRPKSN